MSSAFSLMEMMIVLLIVAIIAAATAPMVTKKMMRDAGSGESPWVFTGLNSNDIAFNMGGGNDSVIIGASRYNNNNGSNVGPAHPRLVLATDGSHPGFVFANKNGIFSSQLSQSDSITTWSNAKPGDNSVAIGTNQTVENKVGGIVAIGDATVISKTGAGGIAIGNHAKTNGGVAIGKRNNSEKPAETGTGVAIGTHATSYSGVAIGNEATASNGTNSDIHSIAIGSEVRATGANSIAIGNIDSTIRTVAAAKDSIAIGSAAVAGARTESDDASGAIAIGSGAGAYKTNSIAIGGGVHNFKENSIMLGDCTYTVHIPGNLIVDGNVDLGTNSSSTVKMRVTDNEGGSTLSGAGYVTVYRVPDGAGFYLGGFEFSDRRLKNVGDKFIGGLEQIKKLELYNYTFKADKEKTPHVGVMAQDLQKVFPNAVWEGQDGYLRIRWDEMFYSLINAVKELDQKITAVVEQVKSNIDKTQKLEAQVKEQQQTIDDLTARIEKLEKTVKKRKAE